MLIFSMKINLISSEPIEMELENVESSDMLLGLRLRVSLRIISSMVIVKSF